MLKPFLLLLTIATLAFGGPAAAEEGFVPRDLRACAADKPAAAYEAACKQALTPAEAEAQLLALKDRDFAVQIDGDTLLVAARLDGAKVRYRQGPFLCCEMQAYLDKIGPDAYAAKLRWNRMAEAMIDLRLRDVPERGDMRIRRNGSTQFVMFDQAMDKRVAEAAGFAVSTAQVDTHGMLGVRKVTTLAGPDCRGALADCTVIYMPDGEYALGFVLNALANQVDMRRFVVVGIHNDEEDTINRRIEELLFGVGPRYDLFMRFVTGDLAQRIEGTQKPRRRIAAGYSNGGAWALDALLARPDWFEGAIIMSPAQWNIRSDARLQGRPVTVGAGFIEPAYRSNALAIAARLRERGAAVKELYIPSGHSMNTWVNVWNAAIVGLNQADQRKAQ
jgi:enterochelin esterase-like enzyme